MELTNLMGLPSVIKAGWNESTVADKLAAFIEDQGLLTEFSASLNADLEAELNMVEEDDSEQRQALYAKSLKPGEKVFLEETENSAAFFATFLSIRGSDKFVHVQDSDGFTFTLSIDRLRVPEDWVAFDSEIEDFLRELSEGDFVSIREDKSDKDCPNDFEGSFVARKGPFITVRDQEDCVFDINPKRLDLDNF